MTIRRRAAGFYDPRTYDWAIGDSAGRGQRCQFYVEQTAAAGSNVLELGCGTGNIALALADRGTPVVGLDISADMLAVAQAKGVSRGPGKSQWVQADMAAFAFRRRFSAVIVPYHALFHLLRLDALAALLRRIHDHLEPGGIFLADVPTRAADSPLRHRAATATLDGIYHVTATESFDEATRRLSTRFDYLLQRLGGGTETWSRGLEYLVTKPEGLVALARRAGFGAVTAFAAFDADRPVVPGADAVLRAERRG